MGAAVTHVVVDPFGHKDDCHEQQWEVPTASVRTGVKDVDQTYQDQFQSVCALVVAAKKVVYVVRLPELDATNQSQNVAKPPHNGYCSPGHDHTLSPQETRAMSGKAEIMTMTFSAHRGETVVRETERDV